MKKDLHEKNTAHNEKLDHKNQIDAKHEASKASNQYKDLRKKG